MIRAVDLFCGSGGLSLGLRKAGIEVVAAADHWAPAVATYRRNLGDHVRQLDLRFVDASSADVARYRPDIIVGGPPCQDFSTAGKRIEGKQANLTAAFAEIIAACNPPLFLMENVPQVRRSTAYQVLRETLRRYHVAEVILDASLCGVPQRRRRFFALGCLAPSRQEWRYDFLRSLKRRQTEERLTVKEYLKDEIDIRGGPQFLDSGITRIAEG